MFSASLGITWVASKSLQFWYVTEVEIFRRKKERVKCNLLLTKCPDDIDEKGNCISASPLVQVICNKKEVECSYFCCPLRLFLFCICLQFAQLMASALLFIILYSLSLSFYFMTWLLWTTRLAKLWHWFLLCPFHCYPASRPYAHTFWRFLCL